MEILLTALTLFIPAIIVAWVGFLLSKGKTLQPLMSFICLVGLNAVIFVSGSFSYERFQNAKFSKEVNLRQVSVQGEQSFNAQITIKYKDGRIDKISLVEGTTVLSKDEGKKNDK